MRVAQGFGEDRARPNPHWANSRARLTFALEDLAALVRRGRYPRKGQCSIATVRGNGVTESALDFLCADCDSLDRVEHIVVKGELLGLTRRGLRADCSPGNINVRQRTQFIDRASGREDAFDRIEH